MLLIILNALRIARSCGPRDPTCVCSDLDTVLSICVIFEHSLLPNEHL